MNIGRAKQIAESGQSVNVTYEGKQIMIQHVNEENGTARIYAADTPDQEHEVSVSSLCEH
ncbi:H-type small acid-soluble spore protein [Bacillus sp. 165]|uniref:H-type small acid-soluble spore protein n=1 Tax=Bacillus sp. 165 TaxID=1529117 RepID=UPI001AD962E3|nr:H-type small acid-soluble spore protein [Bacillus sp. 165]MBO9129125.1 H-type small acid-soluble spore protein [Bacillus sp. 165]